MQSLYTYLGYIIFGIILQFCLKGKENNKLNQKANTLNIVNKKLISQDKKKTNFLIFLTCLGFAIYNDIEALLYLKGYQSLNYWNLEMIFTFILMKRYFEVYIYRHHICSIIFNTVVCSILILSSSFFPLSIEGNQYEFVENKLGNSFYSIIIILIFAFFHLVFHFQPLFLKS